MGNLFPVAAALLAVASSAIGRAAPEASFDRASSPASRFASGASASVTISARIVRGSAGVGPHRAPPLPSMIARHATVTAADGRAVPALIYDFE